MNKREWTIIGILGIAVFVVFCLGCLVLSTLASSSRSRSPTVVAEIITTITSTSEPTATQTNTPRPTNTTAPKSTETSKLTETPKPTPTTQRKFSKLEIANVAYVEGQVRVVGATDLPNGTKLNVDFDVAGRSGSDTYIGTSTQVTVDKGNFTATLTPPNRPEFAKGRYVVSVLFTPRGQTEDILRLVGTNGENLEGKTDSSLGFKVMQTSREVSLALKIVPYPMPNVNAYSLTSPERAFVEFLISWQKKDWNRMTKFTQLTWRDTETKPSETLEAWYGFKDLLGAKIVSKNAETNVVVDITATVYYAVGSEIMTKTITARVIRESAAYSPSPTGQWGVNPLSTLRED